MLIINLKNIADSMSEHCDDDKGKIKKSHYVPSSAIKLSTSASRYVWDCILLVLVSAVVKPSE